MHAFKTCGCLVALLVCGAPVSFAEGQLNVLFHQFR